MRLRNCDLKARKREHQPAPEKHKAAEVSHRRLLAFLKKWCGREDSNFHGLPHSDLNAARLPIPPRPRFLHFPAAISVEAPHVANRILGRKGLLCFILKLREIAVSLWVTFYPTIGNSRDFASKPVAWQTETAPVYGRSSANLTTARQFAWAAPQAHASGPR